MYEIKIKYIVIALAVIALAVFACMIPFIPPNAGLTEGETIVFGAYEQDYNIANGKEDIEWIVLDVNGGKALLISKHCIDAKLFSEASAEWESSQTREWINDTFLRIAFTNEERSLIAPSRAADGTMDTVTLLSLQETEKYLSTPAERLSGSTEYKRLQLANDIDPTYCYWNIKNGAFVSPRGDILNAENAANAPKYVGIRPVIWIYCD